MTLDRYAQEEGSDTSAAREAPGRSRLRWVLVVLAAATFVGIATTLQTYYAVLRLYGEADFWEIAAYSFPDWYIWALLTPLIVALGRRFPLETGRPRNVAAHLVFGVAFALGELLLSCLLLTAAVGIPESREDFWDYYLVVIGRWTFAMLLVYWVILVAGQALDYYRRYRATQVEASELRAQLTTAQLSALRMQLHPHFLFNTLHSIGVLVRKRDMDGALKMLTGLGDLLRHTLDTPRQVITLEEELDFIRRYLEVEQIRFGDRLRVEFDIPDATRDALVPSLILQPLVENAIRHGIAPHSAARTLQIEARRRGGRLELEVRDDGPGLPPGWTADENRGVGLRNVRGRLRRIYGEEQHFEVVRASDGGAVARIELPLTRERADAREALHVGSGAPSPAGVDRWTLEETERDTEPAPTAPSQAEDAEQT